MQPRPLLLVGTACALALGCAANTFIYHERSIELNSEGNDPWGPGGTPDRIFGVLEARGYTVQYFGLRAPGLGYVRPRAPWGIRLGHDGWDQINVIRATGLHESPLPISYRWVVRARTFAADGTEHPASAAAQADVDSIMAVLAAVDTTRHPGGLAPPSRRAGDVGRAWLGGQGTCSGGQYVGAFVALPPWAGTPAGGRNAGRIAATLGAAGWTIAQPLPVAKMGMLVAERPQPAGVDGLTVYAIRDADPSGNGIRMWYQVRAASCDSTGRRALPRPEASADADRLLTALQHVLAVGP
jgi:hypothetical protein